MAWHSDDEKALAKNSAIASLSFGAERKFSFRHKQTKETVSTDFGTREFVSDERCHSNSLAAPFTANEKNTKSKNQFNVQNDGSTVKIW